jgi:hypothetical protein
MPLKLMMPQNQNQIKKIRSAEEEKDNAKSSLIVKDISVLYEQI